METILPGEVAWYVTGRFYAAANNGPLLDAGYFLQLQGIDAGLFSGDPGEGTAHLTFLANPFTAVNLSNGDITLGLDAVGDFAVYLNLSRPRPSTIPHRSAPARRSPGSGARGWSPAPRWASGRRMRRSSR